MRIYLVINEPSRWEPFLPAEGQLPEHEAAAHLARTTSGANISKLQAQRTTANFGSASLKALLASENDRR
jgi:hypothetical protein